MNPAKSLQAIGPAGAMVMIVCLAAFPALGRAEAADAEHRNEVRDPGARPLQRFVGGDARAGERRGLYGGDGRRHLADVT